MGVRIRLPLRVLLPCVAVCLVACGAAAIGAVCVQAADGYVMRQADEGLRACASSLLGHGLVAVPESGAVPGEAPPEPCGMELLSVTGQVLIPAPAGAGGLVIPASESWLAAHLTGPVTVPGSGSGGRWQVVIKAVHYRAQRMLFVFGPDDLRYLISGSAGHGSAGMLVVMAGLPGTGQPAAGYAAAAGTVLVLLAAATFAATWAILRPLREAAGFAADAGQGAVGRPWDVMASLSVLAGREHGRYGMAAARMRGQLQASHAAEAAARRSRLTWQGNWSRHACSCAGRPPSCTDSPSIAVSRVHSRLPTLTGCCNGLPVKSPGWKPASNACACVQPASPSGRIAGPVRSRPTRPPMPAFPAPANRQPVATTQRDRPSSRPIPDRRFRAHLVDVRANVSSHAEMPIRCGPY